MASRQYLVLDSRGAVVLACDRDNSLSLKGAGNALQWTAGVPPFSVFCAEALFDVDDRGFGLLGRTEAAWFVDANVAPDYSVVAGVPLPDPLREPWDGFGQPTVAEYAGLSAVELESWERLVERLAGTLAGKYAADALREARKPDERPKFEGCRSDPFLARESRDARPDVSAIRGFPPLFVSFDELEDPAAARRLRCLELAEHGREGWAVTALVASADGLFQYVQTGLVPDASVESAA